jgi:hypothetical protein
MKLSRLEKYARAYMDETIPLAKYRLKNLPTESKDRIKANMRMFEEKGLLPKRVAKP